MKELIFVCMSEMNRSPTAKGVFNDLLERDRLSDEYRASSAGVLDGRKLTHKDVSRAYCIIAFDGMIANALVKNHHELKSSDKLVQLSVPDIYTRNSEELVAIIEAYYSSKTWL